MVRAQKPDLIIMDVMMPRLNGFDCAAAIKSDQQCSHIPIMMLTVVDDAQRAYGLGVEMYLNKPFEPADILTKVKSLVVRRSNQQNIVVLGNTQSNDALFQLLDASTFGWSEVDTMSALRSGFQGNYPALLIVTDEKYRSADQRAEINTIVGPRSCLVVYFAEE